MPFEFFFFAFMLDLALGDPRKLPHPVEAVGFAVSRLDGALRGVFKAEASEKLAGGLMAVFVVSAAFALTYAVVVLSYEYLGHIGGGIVTVYLAYTTISSKGLACAALAVYRPLAGGDMEDARSALSMIVGRDTAGLEAPDIARGAVETVAENTSDGVVAPLFYLALGGVPLAMAYKAVNTMDSMVGYKSEKYVNFGWAAAKLDDAANFIPARLAAVFMILSSRLLSVLYRGSFSAGRAWRIYLRDRNNHPSPNSGHPEAAAAGSLGVMLGGQSSYFGETSTKPHIGDPWRELGPDAIADCVKLMYAASAVSVLFFAAVSYVTGLIR